MEGQELKQQSLSPSTVTLVCGEMGSIKMAANTKYRIRVWFMVFNATFTTDITKEGLHYINAGNRQKLRQSASTKWFIDMYCTTARKALQLKFWLITFVLIVK